MQDILDRLDAELMTGPDSAFALGTTIATGRRAVRRRRLAVSGAAVAAVVAIAGTAWLVVPGDGTTGGGDGGAATDPTSSATAQPPPEPWEELQLVRTGPDGRGTAVNPEATELERADYTATNGASGEIFRLGYRGEEFYALAADGGFAWVRLPVQGMTLQEWAEGQLTGEKGAIGASWVSIDARSRLTAQNGVRMVEQRPDPGLGDRFAAPGEPTAVAQVEVDGETFFLVVRSLGYGATDVIPYRKDATITTLDAFVDFARERYATNEQGGSEGLR